MKKQMDRLFAALGTKAQLGDGTAEKTVRVFFQSVNSRSWQNMEREFFPLGEVPRGQYICMMPADAGAEAGDLLRIREKEYRLCRVELMTFVGRPAYLWSLCVEKGGEDQWGSNG